MKYSLLKNNKPIIFIQPYSGIITSWFESGKSLKSLSRDYCGGLNLNSPGLSAAQPWVPENAQNRRNHLAVQGCEETMRREKLKIDKDDLLNPSRLLRDRLSKEDFKRGYKIV